MKIIADSDVTVQDVPNLVILPAPKIEPSEVVYYNNPAPVVIVTPVLTWRGSNIYSKVKEVRINKTIMDMMSLDPSFANWVRTIISCHITLNPIDDIEYHVPDQFIDEYGITYLTVETFSKTVLDSKIERGRRSQPELKESTIHIFA